MPSVEELLVLLLVVCISVAFIFDLFGVALFVMQCNVSSVATLTLFLALGVVLIVPNVVGEAAIRRAEATSPLAWIGVILVSS